MHNFIKMTQDICFCQQQHKRINNSYRNREKFLSKDGKKKVRLGLLLFPQPEVHYYTFRVLEVLVEEKVYVRRDKVLFQIILFCLLVIRTSLNTIVECGRVYRHLKNNSYFPNVWCLSLFRAHISNHYQILTCMIHAHSFQSCPTLCDPWTAACQRPLSRGFSRQEYWSGLPFPSPGDLPDPGIKPASPLSPELAGGFLTIELPGKPSDPHSLTQKWDRKPVFNKIMEMKESLRTWSL